MMMGVLVEFDSHIDSAEVKEVVELLARESIPFSVVFVQTFSIPRINVDGHEIVGLHELTELLPLLLKHLRRTGQMPRKELVVKK